MHDVGTYFVLVGDSLIIVEAGCCSLDKVSRRPRSSNEINSLLGYGGTIHDNKKYKTRGGYRGYVVHRAVRGTFYRGGNFRGLRTSVELLDSSRRRVVPYSISISNACLGGRNRRRVLLAICSVARLGGVRQLLGVRGRGTISTRGLGSTFVTGVDRRVHAPLGTVINFSNLLTSTSSSARGGVCLSVMTRGGSHLLRVIASMLSLSGVRSNDLSFRCSRFSMGSLLYTLRNVLGVHLGSGPRVGLVYGTKASR